MKRETHEERGTRMRFAFEGSGVSWSARWCPAHDGNVRADRRRSARKDTPLPSPNAEREDVARESKA